MTAPKMQIVSYENFSGGETSRLGELKAQDGSFHAENMLVYSNGLLGPRPGFVNGTPTSMPTGKVRMIGTIPVTAKDGILIVGRTVYYWDLYNSASAATAFGTQLADVAGNSKPIPWKPFTARLYITVPGDKVYKVDASDAHPISGSPGGVAIEISGERMFIAESQTSRRIFYNDPNTGGPFETWNSDFFDVDDEWQVTAIRRQRQGVILYKARSVSFLTGIPGVNGVQRPLDDSDGPLHPWQEDLDDDGVSWFIPVFGINPANFNGSKVTQISNLKELSGPRDESPDPTLPLRRGLAIGRGDATTSTVVAVQNSGSGDATFLVQHNGIWTRHTTDLDLAGQLFGSGEIFTFTDGGGASAAAKIYHTRYDVQRPAFASDEFGRPGDDATTPFEAFVEFPRWEAPDGKEVRVRSVIVDFQKWNTGQSSTNHFKCEVTTTGAESYDGAHTTYEEWDEVQTESATTAEGTPARAIFRFHDDAKFGGGFQLCLRSIRGVAIKKAVVELEVDPNRPRT